MAIKNGDTVKVHYTGTLKDGTEFDSSKGRSPLEFVVGSHSVIPGFEAAVLSKKAGDKFTVEIPADQAYKHDPDLVFAVSMSEVPDHIPLEVGTPLHLSNEQGQLDAVITEVGPKEITLDANSPLAGKDLVFDIEIVDVKSPKE